MKILQDDGCFAHFEEEKQGLKKKGVTAPFSGKKGTRRGCP